MADFALWATACESAFRPAGTLETAYSNNRRGAIPLFERIRAAGPDPASALLEGICWYELQEDEEAVPLLREAERDPTLAPSAFSRKAIFCTTWWMATATGPLTGC